MANNEFTVKSALMVERVTFTLGDTELEGYFANELDKIGNPIYYMSAVGMATALGLSDMTTRYSSMAKELKTLLGKDFTTRSGKYKNSQGGISKINLWRTHHITTYCAYQAKKGNETALNIIIALATTTLDIVIGDAFGHKYKQYQAEQKVKARLLGKIIRRELTDSIRDYLNTHKTSENYRQWIYSNCTDAVNLIVFNRRASQLRLDWDCDNPRDCMTAEELEYVRQVEALAMRLIDDHDWEPLSAVRESGSRLLIPVQGRV